MQTRLTVKFPSGATVEIHAPGGLEWRMINPEGNPVELPPDAENLGHPCIAETLSGQLSDYDPPTIIKVPGIIPG